MAVPGVMNMQVVAGCFPRIRVGCGFPVIGAAPGQAGNGLADIGDGGEGIELICCEAEFYLLSNPNAPVLGFFYLTGNNMSIESFNFPKKIYAEIKHWVDSFSFCLIYQYLPSL